MIRDLGRRLASHLRREDGDTDPILTIVSMLVTAVVTAAIVGALISVIQLGGNYVKEQVLALNLSTAQKTWNTDANNASLAQVQDEHHVVFYEMPDRHPGVYIPRNDQTDTYCRKSSWSVEGGTVTNVVAFYQNPTCETVDTSEVPDSTTTLLTIAGLTVDGQGVDKAAIEAKNSAGRDLHFIGGSEVGLAQGSAAPSVNTRHQWWRDYEWNSVLPREINLVGTIVMPLSGNADSTLTGSTWNSVANPGGTTTTPEIIPDITLYNPGPITGVTVERSATVGDIHGGVREGISVGFNQVLCGPYSTSYTVTWTPTTPGAVVRSSSPPPSFGTPPPVNLDRVPNGATGNVTITAACPPEVSTTISTSPTNPYTQPIPGTVLTAAIGALPHQHDLAWSSVSSLPVTYLSEVSFGGAFAPQNRTEPNPTTGRAHNLTFPEGSTYGMTHVYRVTASLGGVVGNPSNEVALTTPWPPVDTPTISGSSTGKVRTVTVGTVTCPAGTYGEYRQRFQSNNSGWQGWSPWSATVRTLTYTLLEGEKADFEGQARCTYSPTQFSPPSPAAGATPWVQPIVTAPNPPVITIVDGPDEPDPVTVRYEAIGCPTETYPEYRERHRVDEAGMGSWSAWTLTPQTTLSMWMGQRLIIEVQARCISDFTPGQPGTEGPPATTVNPPWVRPIDAPAAPILTADGGGVSAPKLDRILWTPVVCPTMTSPQYNPNRLGGGFVGWMTALSHNIATWWGTRYIFDVVAVCESPYGASPLSPSSNRVDWTTPIPQPANPWISVPGSAYAGNSFGIAAGGSTCAWPSNTYYNFTNSRDGASPADMLVGGQGNANTSDYWGSPGYVTYSVRIQCRTADASSDWSAWASDGISIVQPPAPDAPSGAGSASGNWTRYCGNVGFQGTAGWNASSGASSYNVQVSWRQKDGSTSGWVGAGSTGSTSITVNQSGSVANSPQIQLRVQAVGAGGSSGWSQVPIAATLGCF